jgi:hypothetical protein
MIQSGTRAAARHPAWLSAGRLPWLAGLVGLALVLALLALWTGRHPGEEVSQEFPVAWQLAPLWPASPPAAPEAGRREALDLAIYFDVSQPLGGFVTPSRGAALSDYELIFDQVPDRLIAEAGGSRSRLSWWAVATEVTAVERPQPLRRAQFKGKDSRLDLAVAALLEGFAEGRLRAAVLITDLVSTGELTGAMGVAKSLSDSMSSHAVRSGALHAGLLGVRATYWGVETSHCHGAAGRPCWFSEQAQSWRPLPAPTRVPFYVLVLGRSADEVDRIGQGLQATARRHQVDSRWELLSAIARRRQVEGRCRLASPGEPGEQFTLVREARGEFSCQRRELVEIACTLPHDLQLLGPTLDASWQGARAELRGDGAVLTLDCGALREQPPAADLTLRLTGAPGAAPDPRWQGWSTETDTTTADLGKTLQLDAFLDKVKPRPARMELISSPLLLGRKHGR